MSNPWMLKKKGIRSCPWHQHIYLNGWEIYQVVGTLPSIPQAFIAPLLFIHFPCNFPPFALSLGNSPKFLYICVRSQIWKLYLPFKPREFDIRNRVNRYGSTKEQKEDLDITQKWKLQETATILWEQREVVIKPQELGGRILKWMVTLCLDSLHWK